MKPTTFIATIALLAMSLACNPTPSGDAPSKANNGPPPDLWAGMEAPESRPKPTFSFERAPAPLPKPNERKTELFGVAEAPKKPEAPKAAALKVERTQPAGDVGMVWTASATFNQPMIELGALGELDKADAPLKLDPTPPGRFRWLGTRTIEFDAEERFPMSTRYKATIPAGTVAVSGEKLAEAVTFEFETTRLRVDRHWLSGTELTPDDALIMLSFNQRINTEALKPHITLTQGGRAIPLALVEQPLKHPTLTNATIDEERTIALKPTEALPLDTTFKLTVKESAPSAEGPLPMGEAWTTSVSTYGPMEPMALRCQWHDNLKACPVGRYIAVLFSNALKTQPVDQWVTVTPEPSGGVEVSTSGSGIEIYGDFEPATTYTVEVKAGVEDIYGQVTTKAFSKRITYDDRASELKLGARGMALVESTGPRALPITVTNIDSVLVQAARLEPKHLWQALQHMQQTYQYNWAPFKPDYLKISSDRTLKPGLERNVEGSVGVPLGPILGEGVKSGLVALVARAPQLDNYGNKHYAPLIVQVTDIGLAVRYDLDHLYVLANRLSTGEPLEADLRLLDRHGKEIWQGKAGADGFVKADGLRAIDDSTGPFTVIAAAGDDQAVAVIDGHGGVWSYNGKAPDRARQAVSHVTTDRNIYRPGETVHMRGVMRMKSSRGGTEPLPEELTEVTWNARDARGRELVKEATVKLSGFDTFAIDLDLPDDVALGWVYVSGSIVSPTHIGSFTSSIKIAEYRAPEFEVNATLSPDIVTIGEELQATIQANYLFGAPMRSADVRWSLSRSSTSFTPPNQEGFNFGVQSRHRGWRDWNRYGGAETFASGNGQLTEEGSLSIKQTIEPPKPEESQEKDDEPLPPQAEQITLSATVTDQNRQQISTSASIVAHPASFYAGVKLDRSMYKEGQSATLSAVAVSPDGERVIGRPLKVSVVQTVMKRELVKDPGGTYSYTYTNTEKEIGSCDVKSAAEPAPCKIRLTAAGYFLARVTAADKEGRAVRTDHGFYVTGKGYIPWRQDEGFKVELITDRPEYSAGDTAQILVKSPFEEARGLLTIERDGVVEHRVVHLKGSASTIDVTLREAWLPGVDVALVLVRGRVEIEGVDAADAAQDLGRPAFAEGRARLKLSTASKRLTVGIKPSADQLAPGEALTVNLNVTDSAGKGVESEVAVYVVDEGVLSLLGYSTPDPLAMFHSAWGANTGLKATHNDLIKRDPDLEIKKLAKRRRARRKTSMNKRDEKAPVEELREMGYVAGASATASPGAFGLAGRSGGGMDDDFDGALDESESERGEATGKSPPAKRPATRGFSSDPIKARATFLTTAYTNQQVVTDAQGNAKVTVTMPDNLTTWRVMAIAVDRADKFGSADANVTVRKPLLLRPALPRFASRGDQFQAGVVINNETGADIEATVGLRGTSFTMEEGDAPRQVTVKAGAAAEVSFPVKVTTSGQAVFQFVVRAGDFADAAEVSIPVYIPVTTEAFATYGTTESSVAQPVKVPDNVIPSFGGLEVAMSSTALTGLEDAARYLQLYRYGCLEQTSSRLIPLVALGPLLDDFKIEGIASKQERDEAAQAMITRLSKMQHSNGGFTFWPGSRHTSPYATTYALWALHLASSKGVAVPQVMLDRGATYLVRQLRREVRRWGKRYGLMTRAQAAFVLALMGKTVTDSELNALYDARNDLPTFSRFALLGAMHLASPDSTQGKQAELRRLINNAVVEKASTVHFAEGTSEDLQLVMHSSTRTDAIGLYVLLKVAPKDPLVPKIIKGLMDARQMTGYWGNTQENALIIAAMADYYDAYEKQTPDYTAQIWYGDGFLGQEGFKGRSTAVAESLIPMSFLAEAGDRDVLLAKEGPGRLYYRLGLRYAPADPIVKARSEGFTVQRTYAPAAGEPEDSVVKTDTGWRIKAGTNLQVKLTVLVSDRSYHVAVDDPLPAGLEAVNTSFKTTAAGLTAQAGSRGYGGWRRWGTFNHTEQRDERVLLFAEVLPGGTYNHTYIARATTPGTYILPPLKAEQMYAPEVFGRTATETVEVVP